MKKQNENKLHCVTSGRENGCNYHLVFVHGLNGNWKTTWMHRPDKKESFWLEWIAEDNPKVCVWSYAYGANMLGFTRKWIGLTQHGEMLLNALKRDLLESGKPVVFVTHSMGGLVAMTSARACWGRQIDDSTGDWEKLFSMIEGFCFMATPHRGSWMANLPVAIGVIGAVGLVAYLFIAHFLFTITPLLYFSVFAIFVALVFRLWGARHFKELRPRNRRLHELTDWFKQIRFPEEWTVRILTEAYGTRGAFGTIVVNDGSAAPQLLGVPGRSMPYPHSLICKPTDKDSDIFKEARDFLDDVWDKLKSRKQEESKFKEMREDLKQITEKLAEARRELALERKKYKRLQESLAATSTTPGVPRLGTADPRKPPVQSTIKRYVLWCVALGMFLYIVIGLWSDYGKPYSEETDVVAETGDFEGVSKKFAEAVGRTWRIDITDMTPHGVDRFMANEFNQNFEVENSVLQKYLKGLDFWYEETRWDQKYLLHFLRKEFLEAAKIAQARAEQKSLPDEEAVKAWNYAALSYRLAEFQKGNLSKEVAHALGELQKKLGTNEWKQLGEDKATVTDLIKKRHSFYSNKGKGQ